MASVTKYPGTVSQTTGGKFVSFSNLNNIKNNVDNAHAVSSVLIRSKKSSPNRPSTVSCTGFGFNLPEGAEPTKITVTYRHRKNAGSDYSAKNKTHICNIGGPAITLLGVSGFSSKGSACTTTMTTHVHSIGVTSELTYPYIYVFMLRCHSFSVSFQIDCCLQISVHYVSAVTSVNTFG